MIFQQLKWNATSLNPYYEGNSTDSMISDDRFLYHTLSNWKFGDDDTGDVMEWKNVETLFSAVENEYVNLVS